MKWKVYLYELGAYRVGRVDRKAWHPIARIFPTADSAQAWLDAHHAKVDQVFPD